MRAASTCELIVNWSTFRALWLQYSPGLSKEVDCEDKWDGGISPTILVLHLSLNVLMTPHFSSRTGNQDSTPSEYWQSIPQKCSYMGLMSLEYFSISPNGQGQQIILDAIMSWVWTATWNLKALALMDVIWFVKQSSQLWCQIIICETCMRLLEALDFIHDQCHFIHTGKSFQPC